MKCVNEICLMQVAVAAKRNAQSKCQKEKKSAELKRHFMPNMLRNNIFSLINYPLVETFFKPRK